MFRASNRPLSFSEFLSSTLSGELVPDTHMHDRPHRRATASPSATHESNSAPPVEELSAFCERALLDQGGVLAAIPGKSAVKLGGDFGDSLVWVGVLKSMANLLKAPKTLFEGGQLSYNYEFTATSVPDNLPDGTAYGMESEDLDYLMDAGISIEFKQTSNPCVGCEVAHMLTSASIGVSPAVFAVFLHRAPDIGTDFTLVIVRQISTLSFESVFDFASSDTSRKNTSLYIDTAVKLLLDKFLVMSEMGIIKLNLAPDTVVLCPALKEECGEWNIHGIGLDGAGGLDGEPRLTGFQARFCVNVPEEARCSGAIFTLHALILLANIQALYGSVTRSDILRAILADQRVSSSIVSIKKNPKSYKNFTKWICNAGEDLDIVKHDLDFVLENETVLSHDGCPSEESQHRYFFRKLVSHGLGGHNDADTRIFQQTETGDLPNKLVQAATLR